MILKGGDGNGGNSVNLDLIGNGGLGSHVNINFDTFPNRIGGHATTIKAIDDGYSNSLNIYTSPTSIDGSSPQELTMKIKQNGDIDIERGDINIVNGDLSVQGVKLDINLNSELLYTSNATIMDNLKQNVLITLYSSSSTSKDIYLPLNPKSGQIINFYVWLFGGGSYTIRAQGSVGLYGYGLNNALFYTPSDRGVISIQFSNFVSFASNKWIVLSKF